jgi:hypothetical protein
MYLMAEMAETCCTRKLKLKKKIKLKLLICDLW